MTRLQGVNFQCHISSPSPNISTKRKIGVVLTADEQQEFSMVYFEIKKTVYDVVTNELVSSRAGNFIDSRREITQVIWKCQISTYLSKII